MTALDPLDLRIARPSLRRRARRSVVAALSVAALAGCGGDDAAQRKAYDEAVAAVARERQTLRNMEIERKRLEGERRVHEFESRVLSGTFAPLKALGLDLGKDYGNELRLVRFFYRKWPLGWVGRLDRLLARDADLLPWYDRRAGDLYGRKLKDRYAKLLKDLDDRIAIQKDRIRNAEEYAEIVRPRKTAG
jgi:hypothetical protein